MLTLGLPAAGPPHRRVWQVSCGHGGDATVRGDTAWVRGVRASTDKALLRCNTVILLQFGVNNAAAKSLTTAEHFQGVPIKCAIFD